MSVSSEVPLTATVHSLQKNKNKNIHNNLIQDEKFMNNWKEQVSSMIVSLRSSRHFRVQGGKEECVCVLCLCV